MRGGINPDNIIDINFERMDEQYPLEAQALYDYVARRLGDGHNYVFLLSSGTFFND
ncbi:hypothetical protein [Olsenella uli]|uniref:hypothetical protein n=1 Tax=Olsenella uli TaxID=133926 RepID=UPI0016513023|nr:hypothetical protein [Olsenella uli]